MTAKISIWFWNTVLNVFSKISGRRSDFQRKRLRITASKLSHPWNICIIRTLFIGISNLRILWSTMEYLNLVISDGLPMLPPCIYFSIQQAADFLRNCWLRPAINCWRESVWWKSWYLGLGYLAVRIGSWKGSLWNKTRKYHIRKDCQQWLPLSWTFFEGIEGSCWENTW